MVDFPLLCVIVGGVPLVWVDCHANCLRNRADAGQVQMDLSKISGNTLLVASVCGK